MALNSCRLFVRHGLQLLADHCLLEVNEWWDVVGVACTHGGLLRLALLLGRFCWDSGGIVGLGGRVIGWE